MAFRTISGCAALASAAVLTACTSASPRVEAPALHAEYKGAYAAGPLDLTVISATENYIAAVPPFWGSKPYFVKADGEMFTMALPSPEPERTIEFFRNEAGEITSLQLSNVDNQYDGQRFELLNSGEPLNVAQLFMARRPEEAAQAALADETLTPDALRAFAVQHLIKHPSRFAESVAFLEIVTEAYPDHAPLKALYGYSLVTVDEREKAKAVLAEALKLDPEEGAAQEAARRIAFQEPKEGEGYRAVLPFSLSDAYAFPTDAEIAAVRDDWRSRDLSAKAVEVATDLEIALDHASFDVKILRHNVHGDMHYGAVWIPKGAEGKLPVLIDARGVNPSYTPRRISRGTTTLSALKEAQGDFITIVPSFRGNTLIINDEEFVSEGDPSDAWDGATDDALAFLNVALEATPQADPEKVAIIGYSRGGSVALLAGVRDERISLVLNVVGPVDFFEAMDQTLGWRRAEILADDMRDGEPPSLEERDQSAQTFDHFFDRVLTEGETLDDVRHRLTAASALYFLETLPETHSYYGAEDRSVPIANPTKLRARLEALEMLGPEMTVRVFENRGHDTDPYLVQQETAKRLVEWAELADR